MNSIKYRHGSREDTKYGSEGKSKNDKILGNGCRRYPY